MDDAGHVPHFQAALQRHHPLVDHLAGPPGDDGGTQQRAVRFMHQLDEAGGVPLGHCPVHLRHRPFTDHHRVAEPLPRLRLVQADVGHFGIGEGGPGYAIGDACGRAGQQGIAGGHEGLPAGVVGELEAAGAIAGGVDVLLAGAQIVVHLDAFGRVSHAGPLQVQAIHVGPASDGHQQRIAHQVLAAGDQVDPAAVLPGAFGHRVQSQCNSFRLEHLGQHA